jgi:ComF family protein
MYTLPRYEHNGFEDNSLARKFWGRVNLEQVAAQYKLTGSTAVKSIIHQIKYKGNKDLGITMGEVLGKTLVNSALFTDVNILVPVPLHPKKERFRGYNQCDLLLSGMATVMSVPVVKNTLVRKKHNSTQTKKNRYERYVNSKEVFCINDIDILANKHVLLVDDVITTGATMEACAGALLEVEGLKLSVATLAVGV